jgi:hypothetical protein
MIKSIYFARRRANSTHAQFLADWRRHAKLSESFPSITRHYRRVIQCGLVVEQSRPELSTRYSGISLLSMAGLAEAVDVYDDPNVEVMLADERKIFADLTSRSLLVTHESVLQPVGAGPLVLVECVRRATGATMADFIRDWTAGYGASVVSATALRAQTSGYVHNHVILPAPAGYAFDGISEIWFNDTESALAVLDDARLREMRSRSAGCFDLNSSVRMLLRTNYVWEST